MRTTRPALPPHAARRDCLDDERTRTDHDLVPDRGATDHLRRRADRDLFANPHLRLLSSSAAWWVSRVTIVLRDAIISRSIDLPPIAGRPSAAIVRSRLMKAAR